jgi:hypothetical protein
VAAVVVVVLHLALAVRVLWELFIQQHSVVQQVLVAVVEVTPVQLLTLAVLAVHTELELVVQPLQQLMPQLAVTALLYLPISLLLQH